MFCYLFINLLIYLYLYLFRVYLFNYLFINMLFPYLYLFIYLFIYLTDVFIHVSVFITVFANITARRTVYVTDRSAQTRLASAAVRHSSCRSNFLSYPVTVNWHQLNQSQDPQLTLRLQDFIFVLRGKENLLAVTRMTHTNIHTGPQMQDTPTNATPSPPIHTRARKHVSHPYTYYTRESSGYLQK